VSDWKRVAESEAVAEGVPPAMPRWEGGVPFCRYDDCVHYDGKRCELLGERPSSLCEPVVAGMAEQLTELRRVREHLARAWDEGAEAAFDAQAPSEDSDYLNPLYGRALDEFYASNPYRRCVDAPSEKETPTP
jgi:hypothetical protein